METKTLCAGYARTDMTPDYSVPLAGYGNTRQRMSQGWYSRIYATCIAITDEKDETLLLFTLDQIRCNQEWTDAARERITQATGVPGERIMLCATHTHSGPDIFFEISKEEPYYQLYVQSLVDAAVQAMEDRCVCTRALCGRTQVPGLTFVRHYNMTDGSVVGDNFGSAKGKTFAGHTLPADEQMQLLKLCRQDKPDVLLVNWQAHPTLGSTSVTESGQLLRPFLGADYVGYCREYVEKQTQCLFAFFLGAAGNLNSRSRIQEETPTTDVRKYGKTLGTYTVQALEDLQEISVGNLKSCREIYTGQLDHTEDHLVEQAKQVRKLWAETNDLNLCKLEAEKYGMHSTYHAGAIINRSKQGAEQSVELNAISLGDFAFVTAPYEMFCNSGKAVKDNSPYPMTFVCSCANHGAAYIASNEAFEHGCYEVDNRKFVRGTAEKLVDSFLDMLGRVKNEKS